MLKSEELTTVKSDINEIEKTTNEILKESSNNVAKEDDKKKKESETDDDGDTLEIINSSPNYDSALRKLRLAFYERWSENKPSPIGSLTQFNSIAVIGVGSYGTVKLVRKKKDDKCYAVKILLKSRIIKEKRMPNILSEKRVLQSIRFPFLVHLEFSLKDNDCIYFGLPYIGGGELFFYLRKSEKFDENTARFYAAQVFLALEYLHNVNLVYRDLKPENILIDKKGYLKLTDFGFCKKIEGRTWTLCGTPEYLAPELIQAKGYGLSIDWWAFGILCYEFVAGYSPFFTPNNEVMTMYEKIVKCDYKFSSRFSDELKDLISNLIQSDITKRYGNLKNGTDDIKNHKWFENINWAKLILREIEPPYIPKMTSPTDWSNFDKYPDLVYKKCKNNQYAKQFSDF